MNAIDDAEMFVDQLIELVCADPLRVSPVLREEMVAMTRHRATMPWAGDAFVDAARSIFAVVVRGRTFARRLRSIPTPALIVHGDQDRLVDVASAKWLARQRPTWQLEIFDGVGHVPQIEVPDRFVDVVGGWLADPVNAQAS